MADAVSFDAVALSDWRDSLVVKRSKKGDVTILPVSANAVVILSHDQEWVGVLAHDAFRDAVITTRVPPWDEVDAPANATVGEWTDADTVRSANWLARHYDVQFHTAVIEQAVSVVAPRNVLHPVRDWLASLAWDGTARIDRLFVDYFGAEDTAYVHGVGARFMIGAVARVCEPGAKVDCTPVLEGPQGIGKSTGIQALAGESWFFDTPITMGDKDGYQSLRGKWIGELGELHALSRSDLNRAKNFLTATSDTYRPSYGRRSRDFPRQCVFYGTTNASEYLRDETGNRRFWPVRCSRVDLAGIRRDRGQLWAEAFDRYAAGERWHVDNAAFRELCEGEQEQRFVADAWEGPIEGWLMNEGHPERRTKGVTLGEVLAGAIAMTADKWTKGDQDRAAAVLRRLGWERGKQARGADGRRERKWKPKAVTLVTEPVTDPVTRELGSQTLLSPVSPADLRTHKGGNEFLHGKVETQSDGGDEVTETFSDYLERQGIGGGE
ncbi:MAG TPA: virulence-associated E family protein [Polyangiaceae bacterium]|jgi:putative DNA primase/helicase|nr:virulence-associated E family protein [Polyangiaceae bacterium]